LGVLYLALSVVILMVFLRLIWPRFEGEEYLYKLFNINLLPDDIDLYFTTQEARFPDIKPGVEKRVVWAGEAGQKTDLAIVYIHGFMASSEETRPLPDQIAAHYGANLVFTRLAGHGRTGAALAEASERDWMRDTQEALAVAHRIGREVVVIGSSTGATLVAAHAHSPEWMAQVKGLVLMAPNFGFKHYAARLLTWPGVRWWGPPLLGPHQVSVPYSAGHGYYWTLDYPSVAALPMAGLVKRTVGLAFGQVSVPALFYLSDHDRVVHAEKTTDIARSWGGPTTLIRVLLSARDDPLAHVLAGDIRSPAQTEHAVQRIISWIDRL
jgi:pimeloyl-ACP methyl ester carboxylesterase